MDKVAESTTTNGVEGAVADSAVGHGAALAGSGTGDRAAQPAQNAAFPKKKKWAGAENMVSEVPKAAA